MSTAHEDLDDLAARMLWPAVTLVTAVHDADAQASRQVLRRLGTIELRALCVVLAALVPDDQALTVLTRWTRDAPSVSDRQAARHRQELEAELAAEARHRRRRAA